MRPLDPPHPFKFSFEKLLHSSNDLQVNFALSFSFSLMCPTLQALSDVSFALRLAPTQVCAWLLRGLFKKLKVFLPNNHMM